MSSQSRVDPEHWKQLEMTRIKKKKVCFEVLEYVLPKQGRSGTLKTTKNNKDKKVSFEVLLHMSSQSSVDLELQFLFPSSKSCAGRMTPIIMESG